jgi:hypothetical protein
MSDRDMIKRAEGDEEILSSDVSDCALERAASAEENAFTVSILHYPLVQLRLTTVVSSLAILAAIRRASSRMSWE